VGGLALSADGSKVFASLTAADSGGVENVYAIPAAGGKPEALTRSTDSSLRLVAAFPADDRLLLQRGSGGSDPQRLVVRERDGSLTELAANKVSRFKGWRADGSSFLLEQEERAAQSSDSYEVATDGYGRKLFHQNSSLYPMALVSPQRRFLAFTEIVSEAVQNLRIQDRETGQKQALRSGEGFMVHIPVTFTADGKALLYLADTASPFRYLEEINPVTGYVRPLVHEDGDVLTAVVSPDGRYAAVTSAAGSRTVLHLYDAKTWARIALPALPDDLGSVGPAAFSRDGNAFAFVASGSRTPQEIFLFDLRDPGQVTAPKRLLAGFHNGIGSSLLASAEATTFPAPDGKSIPGLLLRPAAASPTKKVPAVVFIHDGPAGAAHAGYDPLWQYLVLRGYAVLAVNHRGSLGFGKDFLRADDQRHGSADLEDCLAGRKMLAASGWVDAKRIAVLGLGAHGGYLALAALAYRPTELAAGVDLFGVADWTRVIKGVPVSTLVYRALSDELGSPFNAQTARYLAPVAQAGEIVRPLFVVQGGLDTTALPAESEAIVAALKARKIPAGSLVLADEAGSLTKRANKSTVYRAIADFLDRSLKSSGGK
jgi:dipeptidyl aminopeptidase/acylaminoacyl peptidase